MNGSILFGLFTSKKIAPSLIRVEKKFLSKLSAEGIKRSGILCLFKKCVDLWANKFPKIFSQKIAFLQNFVRAWKSVKNIFFIFAKLKQISAKFRFFWYPLRIILRKFFPTLRISRPNLKNMKHIEFQKKCQNHWTLMWSIWGCTSEEVDLRVAWTQSALEGNILEESTCGHKRFLGKGFGGERFRGDRFGGECFGGECCGWKCFRGKIYPSANHWRYFHR